MEDSPEYDPFPATTAPGFHSGKGLHSGVAGFPSCPSTEWSLLDIESRIGAAKTEDWPWCMGVWLDGLVLSIGGTRIPLG